MDSALLGEMIMQGNMGDRMIQPSACHRSTDRTIECLATQSVEFPILVLWCQPVPFVLTEKADNHILAVDGETKAPYPLGSEQISQGFEFLPLIDQQTHDLFAVVDVHAGVLVTVDAIDTPVAAHVFFALALALAFAIHE
jgi:hypothetical protein